MRKLNGITINGEYLGSSVVINGMFRAICAISPAVMRHFVYMVNQISDLGEAVKIVNFNCYYDSIDIEFENDINTGIASLYYALNNNEPVLTDCKLILNSDEFDLFHREIPQEEAAKAQNIDNIDREDSVDNSDSNIDSAVLTDNDTEDTEDTENTEDTEDSEQSESQINTAQQDTVEEKPSAKINTTKLQEVYQAENFEEQKDTHDNIPANDEKEVEETLVNNIEEHQSDDIPVQTDETKVQALTKEEKRELTKQKLKERREKERKEKIKEIETESDSPAEEVTTDEISQTDEVNELLPEGQTEFIEAEQTSELNNNSDNNVNQDTISPNSNIFADDIDTISTNTNDNRQEENGESDFNNTVSLEDNFENNEFENETPSSDDVSRMKKLTIYAQTINIQTSSVNGEFSSADLKSFSDNNYQQSFGNQFDNSFSAQDNTQQNGFNYNQNQQFMNNVPAQQMGGFQTQNNPMYNQGYNMPPQYNQQMAQNPQMNPYQQMAQYQQAGMMYPPNGDMQNPYGPPWGYGGGMGYGGQGGNPNDPMTAQMDLLKAELEMLKMQTAEKKLPTLDEFLSKQKEVKEAREKKRRQKFRIVGSREHINANALDGGVYVAGNKVYKWGDTKILDQ